jgi:hypothetical protein
MSRKFLITEEEKNQIRGLYGLITEAIDPASGGTITVNNYYKPGFYTLDSVDTKTNQAVKNNLNTALQEVTNFVKDHPNSIVEVKFISQESAIPNKDNEGKEGGDFMPVGGLSDVRKKYLEPYIKTYFDNLKSQGVIPETVKIPPLIYEKLNPVTPWVGTPFCPSNSTIQQQRSTCVQKYRDGVKSNNSDVMSYKRKYDAEQKTQIQITVIVEPDKPSTTDCATGLTIRIHVPQHKCQNAEFFVFANKTLLYNTVGGMTANLNNSDTTRGIPDVGSDPLLPPQLLNPGYGYLKNGDGTYGKYGYGKILETGNLSGGRSDTFIVTTEQSKQIVKDGNGYINIWMVGTTSQVHVDIPVVTITKEGSSKPIYNSKPKVKQGLLLTLDECGNQVVASNSTETVPDVSGYIQEIKNERFPLLLKIEKDEIKSAYDGLSPQGKKKYNLDEKAVLLERCESLLSQMLQFTKRLKTLSADEWSNGTAEKIITDQYTVFYNGLSKSPSLVKSPNGVFVDKTIQGNNLYGDVRMIMDRFYLGFDGVYLDDDQYVPTGIKNDNNVLDSKTILKNIKII